MRTSLNIRVMSHLLPVIDRRLCSTINPYVAQSFDQSSRVAGPPKHGFSDCSHFFIPHSSILTSDKVLLSSVWLPDPCVEELQISRNNQTLSKHYHHKSDLLLLAHYIIFDRHLRFFMKTSPRLSTYRLRANFHT